MFFFHHICDHIKVYSHSLSVIVILLLIFFIQISISENIVRVIFMVDFRVILHFDQANFAQYLIEEMLLK
jgi:hypothetical protein